MRPEDSFHSLAVPDHTTGRWLQQLSEPHRHYHTLTHIFHMLEHLPPADATREMIAAIWLHDIVYDPREHDNEERSAEQAIADLAGTDIDAATVFDLILGTKYHEAATDVQRVLNDLDLMILGVPRDRYAAYTRHIRIEYEFVPAADYAAGRARILEQFDARRIYQTPGFAHLEAAAHANLKWEIADLLAAGQSVAKL